MNGKSSALPVMLHGRVQFALLKDKISKDQMSFTQAAPAGKVNMAFISGGAASEAVDALLVLGYTQAEAEDAVSKLDPSLPPEELIRLALKGLAKFK